MIKIIRLIWNSENLGIKLGYKKLKLIIKNIFYYKVFLLFF